MTSVLFTSYPAVWCRQASVADPLLHGTGGAVSQFRRVRIYVLLSSPLVQITAEPPGLYGGRDVVNY
jgi:hypothetical protein